MKQRRRQPAALCVSRATAHKHRAALAFAPSLAAPPTRPQASFAWPRVSPLPELLRMKAPDGAGCRSSRTPWSFSSAHFLVSLVDFQRAATIMATIANGRVSFFIIVGSCVRWRIKRRSDFTDDELRSRWQIFRFASPAWLLRYTLKHYQPIPQDYLWPLLCPHKRPFSVCT